MTTIIKWLNHPYVIAALMVAGATTDLILIGQACGLSKSDWATWVGSIGTVGTLIGTLWIATEQARIKRNEQLTLALVAAADLKVRVRNVIRSLAQTRDKLRTPLAQPDRVNEAFAECYRTFDDSDMWTTEELVPLVYLPNQTAAKLAWTGISVQSIKADLKKVSDGEHSEWDTIRLLTGVMIYEVNSVLDQATKAHADCVLFLAHHGFESAIPRYQPHFDTANRLD